MRVRATVRATVRLRVRVRVRVTVTVTVTVTVRVRFRVRVTRALSASPVSRHLTVWARRASLSCEIQRAMRREIQES